MLKISGDFYDSPPENKLLLILNQNKTLITPFFA
jgi:hypothetical protein